MFICLDKKKLRYKSIGLVDKSSLLIFGTDCCCWPIMLTMSSNLCFNFRWAMWFPSLSSVYSENMNGPEWPSKY